MSQTRLALASEKPGTCTGPPRLFSPQGAEQEAQMSITMPKGYIPLGEAIARLGQSLSDEWTGEEFAPEFATMANINRDTQDYFIGWVAARCTNVENTSTRPNRRTKENPDDGQPLSTSGTEQWNRASGVYEEARSLINEIAQFESIRNGGGHLAKIWNDPERKIVWEWPENFPLSKDNLEALKVEEEEFRAPREAAYKRLDKAARLLQQELYGTPPDCEDAIPALRHYPDRSPDRIDPAFWIGPAGLGRLKTAARDDDRTQGGSGIIVHLERIKSLCLSVKPPIVKINETAGANPPTSELAKGQEDALAQTVDKLEDWFVNVYVPAHKDETPNPTRDNALSAAKPQFANYCDLTHLRDDLRKIWRDHAPKGWKRTGPRSKTE